MPRILMNCAPRCCPSGSFCDTYSRRFRHQSLHGGHSNETITIKKWCSFSETALTDLQSLDFGMQSATVLSCRFHIFCAQDESISNHNRSWLDLWGYIRLSKNAERSVVPEASKRHIGTPPPPATGQTLRLNAVIGFEEDIMGPRGLLYQYRICRPSRPLCTLN